MASPPDRNQAEIIGVDLPAFLLSKSVCSDPVRAPQHSAEGHHLPDRCRPLASPSTTVRTIKNPASSAGLSHHDGDSARSSTRFYPVLVKNLTIGCTSGLRLILLWEDASSTRL
jgi:hypothetical protein